MVYQNFIAPLIKWWWLVLVAAIVAAGSSYFVASQQPVVYESRATLMIGQTIQNLNPSQGELYLEQQLASTYARIANRQPLRTATMQELGLDWLPEYHVNALPNSQLIEIVVIDTIPERAQAVASELANQMILLSPSAVTEEERARQQFVEDQLSILQNQIIEIQAEIESLQIQLGELTSAREISDTQEQINALENALTSMQSNYATLLSTTQQGATNILTIIESPNLPNAPVGSNKLLIVLVSTLISSILGASGAYFLEYLDKSVKSIDDVAQLMNVPVLGSIPEIPKGENTWKYVADQPRSPIADSFRSLRTLLELKQVGDGISTLLVSGPTVSEGKSTIASNLALIFSQTDRKVILVDADLRRSTFRERSDIQSDHGLRDVLDKDVDLSDALIPYNNSRLSILPAGAPPPNPSELLRSEKFTQTIKKLENQADIIIIDAPPFFVADAVVLASKMDGILIVIKPGYTDKSAVKAMVEQLSNIKVPVLGIIANQEEKRPGYYKNYYHSESEGS